MNENQEAPHGNKDVANSQPIKKACFDISTKSKAIKKSDDIPKFVAKKYQSSKKEKE